MNIILFDGTCNLCNHTIRFILKRDRRAIFKFAPLQSDIGKKLLQAAMLNSDQLNTLVYIENGKYYTCSTAVLRILKRMDGVWKYCYIFIVVPPFFRDFIYKIIAHLRYRLFGRSSSCKILSKDITKHLPDKML